MPLAVPPPGHAYFLVGPTASGKTEAAHRLARELGCEILSADAMLVYRGMDIGTAKPGPGLVREIRYWGLDLVEAGQPFSLAQYRSEAARAASSNAARGKGLVVTGGTGLYVKTLIEGLDEGPPADAALRARWEAVVCQQGVEPLRRELERQFPALYASLNDSDRLNPRRLIRALELGPAGITTVRRSWSGGEARTPVTGLRLPAPILRARIEARVEAMYRAGLLDEVKTLAGKGFAEAPTAQGAIGYAEALACLAGRCAVAEAQSVTVKRTWQLARRQMTWFRHQVAVRWVDGETDLPPEAVVERVRAAWEADGPVPLSGLNQG